MIEADDVLEGISLKDQLTEEQLEIIRDVKENSIDLTIPFHNYTGPGTRLYDNIMNDVRPVDAGDVRSLLHDIRYSLANNQSERVYADNIYDSEDKTMFKLNPIEIGLSKKLLQLKNIGEDIITQTGLDNKLVDLQHFIKAFSNYSNNN